MSHSIEELKRQRDDANARARQASITASEAGERYRAALEADALAKYAARGITPGCKVVAFTRQWGSEKEKRTVCGFLGVEVRYGDVETHLSALKKDGTPGFAKRCISFTRIEPFTEDDGA